MDWGWRKGLALVVKGLFYNGFRKSLLHLLDIALHSHRLVQFGLWLLAEFPWVKTQLLKLGGFKRLAVNLPADRIGPIKRFGQLPETAREIYVSLCRRYRSRGIKL